MTRTSVFVGVMLAAALAGCTRDGGSSSKALSPAQSALLADLPKGGNILFGGNYLRLSHDLQSSPIGKLMGIATAQIPGMTAWQTCFMNLKGLDVLGNARVSGTGFEMAFALKGATIDQVADCAKQAGYPTTIDADKKYIGIDAQSQVGVMKMGYLVLPDGALFSRSAMNMTNPTAFPPADRATLEAALKDGNATADTALVALASKVDKDNVWFVGSAAGTPVADKVGNAWGTVAFNDGLRVDLGVELKDETLASKAEDGVKQMKQQAGILGDDIKGIVDKLEFSRDGNTVHAKLALDNKQIQTLVDKLGPMMRLGH